MQHLKILFALVLIAFLLAITSCKKESKTTEVTGFVADNTSLAAIPGAKVFLAREKPDCFSCQTAKIAEYTADANGKFAFSFEHDPDFLYSVTASQPNYWESFSGGVGLKSGEKNTAYLTLTPKAYIRVFIKNVNPYDGDDVIGTFSFGGGGLILWNDGGHNTY